MKQCKSYKKYTGLRVPTCNNNRACETCKDIYTNVLIPDVPYQLSEREIIIYRALHKAGLADYELIPRKQRLEQGFVDG